jgi:hypothetical protein
MGFGYILTALVITVSGNPASLYFGNVLTYTMVMLLLVAYWSRSHREIDRTAITFVIVIALISSVQFLTFGPIVLMANIGFLIKICIGILLASTVHEFTSKYVRVMALLSILSLIFYLPHSIGIDLPGILSFLYIEIDGSSARHIGIHNFHIPRETRNSGMFWEPGAFAGYLVLALYLIALDFKKKSYPKWEVAAVIIGLLSTQSTMGYIAGLAVGSYCLITTNQIKYNSATFLSFLFSSVGVIAISYFIYNNVDFIGAKVESQLYSVSYQSGEYQINRFGNFLYDLDFILQRPIIGWSGNPETRFSADPDLAELISGQGNALTGFCVRFGIIGYFYLMLSLYLAAKHRHKNSTAGPFMLVIIALLFMGEQYPNFPLIYAFIVGRKFAPKEVYLRINRGRNSIPPV